MKQQYKLSAAFASVVFLLACSKSFITLPPVSNQTTATFFKSTSDFQQAVNAIYDGLQSNQTYGKTFYYMMEVRSDNTDIQDRGANSGAASAIDLFTEVTTNPFLSDAYAGSYVIVTRANSVLDQLDAASIPDSSKKQFQGEALFLRSLSFFNLVRLYGAVPLVLKTETTTQSLSDIRNPVPDVYAQIEKDLQTASSLLPVSYSGAADLGRATSGSAKALLGKVYVTEKKWPAAVTTLTPLIGSYSLLANYADLYNPANIQNAENIFAVRFKKGLSPSEGNTYFTDMVPTNFWFNGGKIGGSYNNRPTINLSSAYTAGDKRFPATLDTTYPNTATTFAKGNYEKKYLDPPSTTGDEGNSFYVLRYADVLLLLSEALNQVGYNGSTGSGTAFYYLNQVRERAGLPDKAAADLPDQASFENWIFNERRFELALENDRWFDIVRNPNGVAIMQAYLLSEYNLTTPVLTANDLLFPIPQSEIDVHNNSSTFPQNPQ
jgi:starch-binding outer membrane protein, SusD/RagB family